MVLKTQTFYNNYLLLIVAITYLSLINSHEDIILWNNKYEEGKNMIIGDMEVKLFFIQQVEIHSTKPNDLLLIIKYKRFMSCKINKTDKKDQTIYSKICVL